MTYHLSGLGQAFTAARGASGDVARLQTQLIQYGLLNLRAPDGVISSANSPTVQAVRAYASRAGMSASGVARTSSGGLVLPRPLFDAILAGPPSPSGGSGEGGDVSSGKGGGESGGDALDARRSTQARAGSPSWLPWVLGAGAAVVVLGTVAAVAAGRR